MKLIRVTLRSINGSSFLSRQCHRPWMAKALFTSSTSGNEINDNGTGNSFESADDFERRIFSGFSDSRSNNDAFFQKLDRLEKAHGRSGFGSKGGSNNSEFFDGLDESFNTLSDGMDGKLKKAATYFEFNPDEITGDDYSFRADVTFRPGMTYDVKVL
uniref:Uncharacterized protein n=1 Tax=Nelumbo nucifera TaxID=4432 RepID=A0A822YFX3_NELNU|nr:TPA_asm: hypothetical protein HUJ06_031597 [Nelumbo nucifera]